MRETTLIFCVDVVSDGDGEWARASTELGMSDLLHVKFADLTLTKLRRQSTRTVGIQVIEVEGP